jgi:hypothetical protein
VNNISSKWFSDLNQNDPEAKQRRIELVQSSTILDVLGALIKIELEKLTRSPEAEYDNPNWSFREADRNGQARVLQQMYSLTKRN